MSIFFEIWADIYGYFIQRRSNSISKISLKLSFQIWVNALPWRRHLEDTIAKYFFWGAKLALKKAPTTVTDMKQPELAWFVRILQKSLQMIWIRAVKWGMYRRFVVLILVLLMVSQGWTGIPGLHVRPCPPEIVTPAASEIATPAAPEIVTPAAPEIVTPAAPEAKNIIQLTHDVDVSWLSRSESN